MQILSRAFGALATNSFLLIDEDHAVWIDPAPGSASWVDSILPHNVQIDFIVLTHSHWDHIADVGRSKRAKDVTVFMHPLDQANLKNSGSDGLGWPEAVLKPLPCPIAFFNNHESWSVGKEQFEVLHTPGHSMGSCCFLNQNEQLLFSGDTLFPKGFGRVDLPTSRPKLMQESLQKLAQLSPELTLLPGHGDPCKLGELTWLKEWHT